MPGVQQVEWVHIEPIELHYDHFLGDIIIKINSIEIGADWGWVPVLDFAICMNSIVKSLDLNHSQAFEFTESEAMINLVRISQDELVITPNFGIYENQKIEVNYHEFVESLRRLFDDMIKYLLREIPGLRKNPQFKSFINE